jgi:phosphoglycerate dehydrogenase-like enzyme
LTRRADRLILAHRIAEGQAGHCDQPAHLIPFLEEQAMKVLIGPNLHGLETCLPDVEKTYPDVEFAHCASWEDLERDIADADVFLGWLRREHFLAANRLKWIQSPSTGVDRFLAIPELAAGDVLLTSATGSHGPQMGEHTMAMILALTRGIRGCVLRQQEHRWGLRELAPQMIELTGSTLGIIGFGTSGRAIAKRAQAFDMRIVAVDLFPTDRPDHVAWLGGTDNLDQLLRESDYVVVTVPFTRGNEGSLGADQLALMKPTARLIVISRGGIVDEAALARALREGRLAGAALDVTATEPLPPDSELWDIENLLISPHLAGGSQLAGQRILEIFIDNLGRFVHGEFPLRNQVDKQRGF